MWFWLALIALLCWSSADLFCKLGCRNADDRTSHLKMLAAVGLVMGLHAAFSIFVQGTVISWQVIWAYLPVSMLYILSMALGYLGLRYIELSVSSPICNASGAVVAVICLLTGTLDPSIAGAKRALVIAAVGLVCFGVIGLGFVEAKEDDALRRARQDAANHRYAKSPLALLLPIAYCLLDAAGTYADSLILQTLPEDSANAAYELTFCFVGTLSLLYVTLVRKQPLWDRSDAPKLVGAAFETAGQVAYVYALSDADHVALTVPMISAYCTVSVILGRIFLKEKLSKKHYVMIALVIVGIILLGCFDI